MGSQEKATEALRSQIDQLLLTTGQVTPGQLEQKLLTTVEQRKKPIVEQAIFDYLCHLTSLGVVGIRYQPSLVGGECWIRLSTRGRALLKRGEQSPHDPIRYLEAVRERVQPADPIAMTYLDEAVGAWAAGLNRSSAVMLGCACERLVLLLGEAIAQAGIPPWSDKIAKRLKGVVKISEFFDEVLAALRSLGSEGRLPRHLRDALDRKLSAVFDHARGLRNDCGHPTDAEVSAEDAESGLLLFPGFYAFCRQLIEHLKTLP